MDFGLVAAFLVAVVAGLWSWKSMQPDEKYGTNATADASEALFLRKNPKKGKSGKGKDKAPKKDKNRRGSTSTTATGGKDADAASSTSSATTATVKSEVLVSKVAAPAPATIVEEAPKKAAPITSVPAATMNIKQITNAVQKTLDTAGERKYVVLEQLKLVSTDQLKEVTREKRSFEKILERERAEATRNVEDLRKTQDTLKFAMRENNDYKAKNKMVADRARAEVSKQIQDQIAQIAQLKGENTKLSKTLSGITNQDDAYTKKIDDLSKLNEVLKGAMMQHAMQAQPASPDTKLIGEIANLKQQLKSTTDASAKAAKSAAESLAAVKKQSEATQGQLVKAKRTQDALRIELEEKSHSAASANTTANNIVSENTRVCAELNLAKAQASDSATAANELKAELEKTQSQLAGVTNDVIEAKAALAEAKTASAAQAGDSDVAAAQAQAAADEIAQLKADKDVLHNTAQSLSEAASNELGEYKAMLSEIQVRLETMEATEQNLREENESLKAASATRVAADVPKKLEAGADDLKASLLNYAGMANGFGSGDTWVSAFVDGVSAKASQQGEVDRLSVEQEGHAEALAKALAERAEFEQMHVQAQNKLQVMVLRLDQINTQLTSDDAARAALQSKLETTQADNSRMSQELAKLKEAMHQVEQKAVTIKDSFEKDMTAKDASLATLQSSLAQQQQSNARLEKELTDTKALVMSRTSQSSGAGECSSPASEKWVMLNGQQREGIQSMSSSGELSDPQADASKA